MSDFVVHLDPAFQDARATRTGKLRRIGGTLLILFGVAMVIASIAFAVVTIDIAKAIYGWIISAALGLFAVWIGWGQITSVRSLPTSATPTEVFTISSHGIAIPFPGQRVPVLERGWGAFTFTLGTALGKSVLHFTSDNGPKGDFQLTQMDASAAEVDAALRRLSRGRQGVVGMPGSQGG